MTLKEWRIANRFSQSALARLIAEKAGKNVAQNTIHTWEKGVVPPADIAEAIRKITGGKVKADSFGRKAVRPAQ